MSSISSKLIFCKLNTHTTFYSSRIVTEVKYNIIIVKKFMLTTETYAISRSDHSLEF